MNDITDKMTANEFRALLRGEKVPGLVLPQPATEKS